MKDRNHKNMKINRLQLEQFLEKAKSIVPKRPSLPVLECALLSGSTLTATDLNTTLEVSVNTESNEECCLPIKQTHGFLKANKEYDTVFIELGELVYGEDDENPYQQNLTIKFDEDNYLNLTSFPSSTFPRFECSRSRQGTLVTFEQKEILEALEKVTPFASNEEPKQVLTSVAFNFYRNELATTDGHRLAVKKISALTMEESEVDIKKDGYPPLLPKGVCKNLIKFIKKDKPKTINFYFQDNDGHPYCLVSTLQFNYLVRLIEGQYPAYDQLIPNTDREFVVDKKDLLETLKLFKSIDKEAVVRLDFSPKGLELNLKQPKSDNVLGYKSLPMEGEITEDNQFSILLALPYLYEGINVAKTKTITIKIPETPPMIRNHLTSPIILDCGFTYLLMPLKPKPN
jgi:DNA polymerase III sliding clamp (beta) subunit (PCNA family)